MTSDGVNIGFFANLILNKQNGAAYAVVMPPIIQRLGVVARSTGIRVITGGISAFLLAYFYAIGQVAQMVTAVLPPIAGEITNVISMRTYDKQQLDREELSKIHYLFPVGRLVESKGENLKVNITNSDCGTIYENVSPSMDSDIAFFELARYTGPYRNTPTTLGLQSLRGMSINDQSGSAGRVTDALFNPPDGHVAMLEIEEEASTKRRRVPFNMVKFEETGKVSVNAKLRECPLVSE